MWQACTPARNRREANGQNAIWQADHTPLDILLIRPGCQAVAHDRHPAALWLGISSRSKTRPRCTNL
jgi:hypothetical protein